MYVLIVELVAKPNCLEQIESLLYKMVGVADQEEGILYYSVNRPIGIKNTFFLYELYKTKSDWEIHLKIPFIHESLKNFKSLLERDPKITVCETAFTTSIS